ncbi:MAG: small basic protein [Planctomycetia bacterium]|nr:small basic protein [Planctomycetia bacterium]
MTIDKSLKIKKGVTRSRNVLTRVERIEKLQSQDKWTEETSPLSLPKVRVFKVVLKKKKKAKDEAAAGATPAAAAKGKK